MKLNLKPGKFTLALTMQITNKKNFETHLEN